MARKSLISKEYKKAFLVEKYKSKRDQLRNIIKSINATNSEKLKAQIALQKLPAKSSSTRLNSRCQITGRSRAVLRKFGLCRHKVRELVLFGNIPGMKKASW
jgi:small subunit ribosomal protein S14